MKVLVTRPAAQAGEFCTLLEQAGFEPILMPALEIVPLEPGASLGQALQEIDGYDWIVFTSVNGVDAVARFISSIPLETRIAAIGPATAAAVESRFRKPNVVPDEFLSEAIDPALGEVRDLKILLARADIARPELTERLRARGAQVTEAAAYEIRRAAAPAHLAQPNVITATSSSAARATFENLSQLGHHDWAQELPWICIGPVTAATASELGCSVAAIAHPYTIPGLLRALIAFAKEDRANARTA